MNDSCHEGLIVVVGNGAGVTVVSIDGLAVVCQRRHYRWVVTTPSVSQRKSNKEGLPDV